MQIKESHFRGVDLNLLVTLSVLLRERSGKLVGEQCIPSVRGA